MAPLPDRPWARAFGRAGRQAQNILDFGRQGGRRRAQVIATGAHERGHRGGCRNRSRGWVRRAKIAGSGAKHCRCGEAAPGVDQDDAKAWPIGQFLKAIPDPGDTGTLAVETHRHIGAEVGGQVGEPRVVEGNAAVPGEQPQTRRGVA